MAHFNHTSTTRLLTCHAVLQELMKKVVVRRDCSIVCGRRTKKEQNKAFDQGFSKLEYPKSKHNSSPSMAVDVVPYPEKWGDMGAFDELSLIIHEEWAKMDDDDKQGYELRWGGDWDGDGDRTDQTFHDLPHYELIGD